MTAFVIFYGLMLLTVLAICSDSKRREQDAESRDFDRHVNQAIDLTRPTVADEAEAWLRRLS